jgi:hypothetical protein
MHAVKVQLLYFDGCPNWTVAEERLRHALELVCVPATVERCIVDTPATAERLQFVGSPSVLLDGRDPFPSVPGTFGMTCRIYDTPGGPSGVPTMEQLVEAVKEAASA